jgi:hypothetical protein
LDKYYYIENVENAQRGATLVHRKYIGERLRGNREEKKKIRISNHKRGKPSCRPSEEGSEKEM